LKSDFGLKTTATSSFSASRRFVLFLLYGKKGFIVVHVLTSLDLWVARFSLRSSFSRAGGGGGTFEDERRCSFGLALTAIFVSSLFLLLDLSLEKIPLLLGDFSVTSLDLVSGGRARGTFFLRLFSFSRISGGVYSDSIETTEAASERSSTR